MLIKKDEKLQIRVDSELLERFKNMANERGVHASLILRHIMSHACKEHEESMRKKREYEKKQAEKRK